MAGERSCLGTCLNHCGYGCFYECKGCEGTCTSGCTYNCARICKAGPGIMSNNTIK